MSVLIFSLADVVVTGTGAAAAEYGYNGEKG